MRRTLLAVLLAAAACGPGSRNTPGGDDTTGDGGNGGSNVGSGSDGCADDAKLIFVVDDKNILAQFNPMTKAFTQLGTLKCPAGKAAADPTMPATPFSMAVDRTAQAYVLYNDDKIYKVDTTQPTLPCTATAWTTQDNLHEFGMGYSTDMPGGMTDTLFFAGGADLNGPPTGNASFATINTAGFTATPVGMITGRPELTGNADAELWGWFPDVTGGTTTPRVAQIDKSSGALVAANTYMEPTLDDGQVPKAWAFGFYGGDYWVFLQLASQSQTTVYEVAGPHNMTSTPGKIVSMTPAVGLTIVGAGVSTCAPTQIFTHVPPGSPPPQ
jgi:hypothetical protein